jgi:hypothetical protein
MKNNDNPRTATQAQIDANRRNAAKSTGPRTAQGRAASSRNGLTHGLCANKHILPGEDPEEFLFRLKDLFDRFRPVGAGEETLVTRIAAGQWRLDRALPMEAGIYRERFRKVAETDAYFQGIYAGQKKNAAYRGEPVPPAPALPDERDLLARAFNVDCAGPNSLAKLARYETAIERSIDRCLRQLKAFQAARNTPDPIPQPGPDPGARPPEPLEAGPQSAPQPASAPPKGGDYEANPKNGGNAQSCATPPNPTTHHPSPTAHRPQPPVPAVNHPQPLRINLSGIVRPPVALV